MNECKFLCFGFFTFSTNKLNFQRSLPIYLQTCSKSSRRSLSSKNKIQYIQRALDTLPIIRIWFFLEMQKNVLRSLQKRNHWIHVQYLFFSNFVLKYAFGERHFERNGGLKLIPAWPHIQSSPVILCTKLIQQQQQQKLCCVCLIF